MVHAKIEFDKMAAVEARHWWFTTLHRLALRAIEQRFGANRGISILDCGCGTGGFLLFLRRAGYQNLQGFDLSPYGVEYCTQAGLQVVQGDFTAPPATVPTRQFDVIALHDVITYCSRDNLAELLNGYLARLTAGGLLLLNAAVGAKYAGMHDVATQMMYRPEAEEVLTALRDAGANIIQHRRWPFLLAPVILAARARQRRGLHKAPAVSDVYPLPSAVNRLLAALCQLERILPAGMTGGSSLFAAAEQRRVSP